jgi:23S rRNA pseudouridine2604 synthase
MRLNKLMASLGLCSRREADALIKRGRVLVDGECVELGTKVRPDADVEIMGSRPRALTVMLNKPAGYVSAQAEHDYTPAIRLLTQGNQYCYNRVPDLLREKKLAVCGRLDINSTGYTLFMTTHSVS